MPLGRNNLVKFMEWIENLAKRFREHFPKDVGSDSRFRNAVERSEIRYCPVDFGVFLDGLRDRFYLRHSAFPVLELEDIEFKDFNEVFR